MPYTPTIWTEGVTPLGPANFNKMEQGIAAAYSSAAGIASVSGMSFSNTMAYPVLMDANTIYCAWYSTFGKINLTTGVYTGLANCTPAIIMDFGKIDDDHILQVYVASSTLYARIYTVSTNAWAVAGSTALGVAGTVGALAKDPDTGLFYWVCAQGLFRYDSVAKAFTKLAGTASNVLKAVIYGSALYLLYSTPPSAVCVEKCMNLADITTKTAVFCDVPYGGLPNNLLVSDDGILYCLSHSAQSGLSYRVPTTDYCAVMDIASGRLGFVQGIPTGTGGSVGNQDLTQAVVDSTTHTIYAVQTFSSSVFGVVRLGVDIGVVS